jgi:hypothetical protein
MAKYLDNVEHNPRVDIALGATRCILGRHRSCTLGDILECGSVIPPGFWRADPPNFTLPPWRERFSSGAVVQRGVAEGRLRWSLRKAKIDVLQEQLAHAFAGGGIDRVAEGNVLDIIQNSLLA